MRTRDEFHTVSVQPESTRAISSNSTLFEVYDLQQIGFLACQDHSQAFESCELSISLISVMEYLETPPPSLLPVFPINLEKTPLLSFPCILICPTLLGYYDF